MAQNFPETAHNKTDQKKYKENFDSIDWGDLKGKPLKKSVKRHPTAGMCGEFGMSIVDDKAYRENFESIDWGNK